MKRRENDMHLVNWCYKVIQFFFIDIIQGQWKETEKFFLKLYEFFNENWLVNHFK